MYMKHSLIKDFPIDSKKVKNAILSPFIFLNKIIQWTKKWHICHLAFSGTITIALAFTITIIIFQIFKSAELENAKNTSFLGDLNILDMLGGYIFMLFLLFNVIIFISVIIIFLFLFIKKNKKQKFCVVNKFLLHNIFYYLYYIIFFLIILISYIVSIIFIFLFFSPSSF